MKGNNICALAMTNIWDELSWITSFNTPNPIINVKHAEHLKNMYTQMIQQFPGELETKKTHLKRLKNFETNYNQWFNKNWPY